MQARSFYERTLRIDGSHTGALYNLALIAHTNEQRFDLARELYTRVIRLDDKHVSAHYNLGLISQMVDQYVRAVGYVCVGV